MENTFISKLLVTNDSANAEKKHFLYIKSKWLENSLEFNLHTSDTNKTYKGELSAEQLSRCATELDIPFNDFYAECKEALTANLTLPPFEYEIVEEALMFRLIKKDTFSIEYLEVPLKKLSNDSTILDAAVDLINNLRDAKNEKTEMAKKDDNISKELLLKLNKCIKEKENIEKRVLRKFLLLLNSKKDKINELKEILRKHKVTGADDEQNDSGAEQSRDDSFDALTQVLTEDVTLEEAIAAASATKRRKANKNNTA